MKSRSKSTTTTGKAHVYVYAAVAGRPRAGALGRLPGMPGGSPPRLLELGDGVSAVVSDVPAGTYGERALAARLADVDFVAQCGAAHHAVADTLATRQTVLPFRMFTLFSTESAARTRLGRARRRIADALDRMSGRHEWVLRIGAPDPARAAASRTSGRVDDRRTAGGAAFLRAKADARQAQADRLARAAADLEALYARLAEISDAASRRADAASAGLLLDAAFLVDTRRAASFRRALKQSATGLLAAGCAVSLTGPWPPYSFAGLDR